MGNKPKYTDDGCEFATACLDCPLPEAECPKLHPGAAHSKDMQRRDNEIISLAKQGKDRKRLATMFNLSQETNRADIKRGGIMTKCWNSTLEQHTPLRAKRGLERRIPLKAHKGLEHHKRLNPKSDRQRAKDELWNKITDKKCYETGFICLWCLGAGQRNDPTRWDYLDGHHSRKPRYKHNKKRFCYPCHRAPCHGEIEDKNVDVELYPDREAWERRRQ